MRLFLLSILLVAYAGASGPNWSSRPPPPFPQTTSRKEQREGSVSQDGRIYHQNIQEESNQRYRSLPNQEWSTTSAPPPPPPPPPQQSQTSFPYGSPYTRTNQMSSPPPSAQAPYSYGGGAMQQSSSPWMNHVSKAQQEEDMMTEMLRRFPPGMLDKPTVKRFLIARDWEMTRATQLLHEYLNWKKSFGCPVDPKSCLGELMKGKTFIHGTDREGNVLIYHFVRNQDPADRDLNEAVRAAVFWAEQAEKQADQVISENEKENSVSKDGTMTKDTVLSKRSGKVTLCFVRAGASSLNGDLTLARALAPILQNNFPERLDKVLVYPAGPGFRAAWLACQLFLDAATRKKVVSIIDPYELLTYIPPENLLNEFGGLDDFTFRPSLDIPGIDSKDIEEHEIKQMEERKRKIEEYNMKRRQQEEEARRRENEPFLPFLSNLVDSTQQYYYGNPSQNYYPQQQQQHSQYAASEQSQIQQHAPSPRPYGYASAQKGVRPQDPSFRPSGYADSRGIAPPQFNQRGMTSSPPPPPPPPPQQQGWFNQVFGGMFRPSQQDNGSNGRYVQQPGRGYGPPPPPPSGYSRQPAQSTNQVPRSWSGQSAPPRFTSPPPPPPSQPQYYQHTGHYQPSHQSNGQTHGYPSHSGSQGSSYSPSPPRPPHSYDSSTRRQPQYEASYEMMSREKSMNTISSQRNVEGGTSSFQSQSYPTTSFSGQSLGSDAPSSQLEENPEKNEEVDHSPSDKTSEGGYKESFESSRTTKDMETINRDNNFAENLEKSDSTE